MAVNYLKRREAFTIGEEYNFFPGDDIKFEIENTDPDSSWGFFANKSNRTVIHIKYDPQIVKN